MSTRFLNSLPCRAQLRNVMLRQCSAYYSTEKMKDKVVKFYHMEKIPEDIWDDKKDPKYTGYEEVKNCWHYVERLFPKLRIPDPPKKVSSMGWKAPAENVPDLPYFIERNKNHMLPVYTSHVYKDRVLVTQVRKVLGDIWVFEYDMKNYLEEKLNEKVESHVNEITCTVNFRGNHVELVKEWLYNKGF